MKMTSGKLPEIVGSGPVCAVLSPPVTVDSESLGKRQDEGVGNTLGETGEEVQACYERKRGRLLLVACLCCVCECI